MEPSTSSDDRIIVKMVSSLCPAILGHLSDLKAAALKGEGQFRIRGPI